MDNNCEIGLWSKIDIEQINNHYTATLLEFQDITIDILPQIYAFLINSGSSSCDYSAGGIYMWIDYFKYQYCIINDTLFIKGVAQDNRSAIAFSLPIGKMRLKDSVELLRQYCLANGIKLEFSAIPQEWIDEFKTLNNCIITTLDHWADYIYSASALATLTGKKYSKKRNHVNRFFNDYPQTIVEEISATNIDKIKDCFSSICQVYTDNKMAIYERAQVWKILDQLDKLPFETMCLIVDNKAIAFTVGEVIGDTLHVHIEKALHQYSGVSEAINNQFSNAMLQKHNIEQINREDDAGDDGLQKAKMSYHPILLLKKYNVIF